MKKISLKLLVVVVLASCSTSNDVVSNRKVQKSQTDTKGLLLSQTKKITQILISLNGKNQIIISLKTTMKPLVQMKIYLWLQKK